MAPPGKLAAFSAFHCSELSREAENRRSQPTSTTSDRRILETLSPNEVHSHNTARHASHVHPVALRRAHLHPQEGQPRRGHQVRSPCALLSRRQVLQVCLLQSQSPPLERERKSNDSPNRHRVLLKKRYNLLLTQQKSKSSLCSNCFFAHSSLTPRSQRMASPSARLKRQTPKAQCERPLPICI